ncbi:kinesin-like protein at 61F [Dermatophagoides farinae]|uniref:kinesin-like protein at 61F n=1 Tax=Dermatophagoides farinae TaxID=6954 RepID=UPI001F118C2F|nr:kinesin-like protein KIF11-B [Dermatophagoides farinae]
MFRPTRVIDSKTPNNQLNKMSSEEINQNIQVFVRCRPLNLNEKKATIEIVPEKRVIRTFPQNKLYSFDGVFDSKAEQYKVYRSVVEPLVEQVIEGYNCTVFAYGQTGTGKTYTMIGNHVVNESSWEDDPLSGIIPRAIDQLLDELQQQNTEYTIGVSFLELYNEEAYDLLSPLSDTTKLRIYNDSERKGSVIIAGLVEMMVKTKAEIFEILEKGSLKRQTAPTLMNACSSRSHSIFSITVHIKEVTYDGEEVVKIGKLNLVDLAGSENIGRSGAVDERAREASNINKSLLTLGRVITSLVEKSSHIPYRDSKLTRLLQDSLGGRTKTSIIATISPCHDDLDDTISTLDYAQRAKKITNKPEINLKMSKKTLINEYLAEIDRLRRDLDATRDKKGIFVDAKNYAFMEATIELQKQDLEGKEAKIENMKHELEKINNLLTEANDDISQKSQELANTMAELNKLSSILQMTKELFRKKQIEVEDFKILLSAHQTTEDKLLKKAQMVKNVADQCSDDNRKLIEKIDTYSSLEENNFDSVQQFKDAYKEQTKKIDRLSYVVYSIIDDGYKSIDSMINENKKELDAKNNQIGANLDALDDKIENFASRLLKSVQADSDDLITKNTTFESIMKEFKDSIRQEFDMFEQIGKVNIEKTISSLDELQKLNSKNRQIQEQTLMSQVLQIKESSKNITRMIESIKIDFQKAHVSKCQEYEKMFKEFSELKTLVENMNIEIKLKAFTASFEDLLNSIRNEHEEKISKITNNVQSFQNTLKTVLQNDSNSFNNISMKCNEMKHSISKDENDTVTLLDKMDKINLNTCQQNLDKYINIKKCQEQFKSKFDEFKVELFTNFDHTSAKIQEQTQSINETINKNAEEQRIHIDDFNSKSREMVELNRSSLEDLSKLVSNQSAKTLNNYMDAKNLIRTLKTSHDLEMNELHTTTDKLVNNYSTYQSTGKTPKRCQYFYPQTFTPTSPHERILSRFHKSEQTPLDFSENDLVMNNGNENTKMVDSTYCISENSFVMKNDVHNIVDQTYSIELLKDRKNHT